MEWVQRGWLSAVADARQEPRYKACGRWRRRAASLMGGGHVRRPGESDSGASGG